MASGSVWASTSTASPRLRCHCRGWACVLRCWQRTVPTSPPYCRPSRALKHGNGQLDAAIANAFPGCNLEIASGSRGLMSLTWWQPGIHYAFDARELSDGTLRLLCLAAALLTPRHRTRSRVTALTGYQPISLFMHQGQTRFEGDPPLSSRREPTAFIGA